MTRLGVLVSGRGSNLQVIINACQQGRLNAHMALVVSSHPDTAALDLAAKAGVAHHHFTPQAYKDAADLDRRLTRLLLAHRVDWVVLAGYVKMIGPQLLRCFPGRVINIHPSLLPKFGGRGMYGLNVHKAVIAAGEQETGLTIHVVGPEYDRGTILRQARIKVLPNETAAQLADRVLALEHRLYPETIAQIIDGEIEVPLPVIDDQHLSQKGSHV